jgi:hypothetical protein
VLEKVPYFLKDETLIVLHHPPPTPVLSSQIPPGPAPSHNLR